MVTAKKTTAKAPAKVAPVKRRTPKPKPAVVEAPAPKPSTDAIGRVTDLIKWVHSPFKLQSMSEEQGGDWPPAQRASTAMGKRRGMGQTPVWARM